MKAKKIIFGLLFLGILLASGCGKTPVSDSSVYFPKKNAALDRSLLSGRTASRFVRQISEILPDEEENPAEGEKPADLPAPDFSFYANVKDFGAAGNAKEHHPLGVRGGAGDRTRYSGWYWAGHFSHLVTATYYEKFQGDRAACLVDIYQVVDDSVVPSGNQICLSAVNPGPFYEPEAGDWVVCYEAADEERSVLAFDDTAAFEQALAAGNGFLYLPEGDYLISQLTAAKIQELAGPGRIWLKEWRGGVLWYRILGQSELLAYSNYGWIDASRFHDEAWRAMHWITDLPEAGGWTSSADFRNNTDSPCMEYRFDSTRENVNVWLTVAPAVSREAFPETITLCIAKDLAAFYTLDGETEWRRATAGGIEGGMYHSSWNGKNRGLPKNSWVDCGDWIEVTVSRDFFFAPLEGSDSDVWYFHCWSAENKTLSGLPVAFTKSSATVWVKDPSMNRYVTCAVGGDMRSPYRYRENTEYYIHEAYYGASLYLLSEPRKFYAYNVSDECFDAYFPAEEKEKKNR